MAVKKVFVSGCYDLLHSGHVEFFKQASRFGDVYVGIGSDSTYLEYKHRKPMFAQEERLRAMGLDVPEAVKLKEKLIARGFDVPADAYRKEELIDAIEKLVKGDAHA